jgi:hypothetical protein
MEPTTGCARLGDDRIAHHVLDEGSVEGDRQVFALSGL